MADKEVTLIGKLVREPMSPGSKSEHEALRLHTDQGSFVLRRKGGNPFYDESLQELAGKMIEATGIIHDYVFMATEVQEKGKTKK